MKSYILPMILVLAIAFSVGGTAMAMGTNLQGEIEYSMEELTIQRDGLSIWGKLYLPVGAQRHPLVICSHGFGGSYHNTEEYAEYFAENGIAAFSFDFTGGGSGSRSGGSIENMSVLTEARDLGCVLDAFKNDPRIDPEQIILFGESQGGFVSTYTAGVRPEDIAGLIALYPAYVLQDDSYNRNPDPQNGPEVSNFMGVRIGRIYDVDAQSFDIYQIMEAYKGKVLIVHGTADSIAPLAYSERARDTFSDAKLITIDGAGHGFYGAAMATAEQEAVSFINEILR